MADKKTMKDSIIWTCYDFKISIIDRKIQLHGNLLDSGMYSALPPPPVFCGMYSVLPPPPPPSVYYAPSYKLMLLYSTLLCNKIARAPGERKKYKLTKVGGGGGAKQNRSW